MSARNIGAEETALRNLREDLLQRSRAIESYLDWYEASRLDERSGLFDAFLATPPVPVSKGPLGRYLDSVEARGW
jgi:hypothetical protein